MKRYLQKGIRQFHVKYLNRGLPQSVAIYLHSVETGNYEDFRLCVDSLRERGYVFVGPDEFIASSGARSKKKAFLSFDDNFRAWHTALPLFVRLQVTATFYINTWPLRDRARPTEIATYYDRIHHSGERVPLDSAELRAIHQAGHVIGAHTHNHERLTALPLAKAKESIAVCKQMLEDILGSNVEHFSYPFGMRRDFNVLLGRYCQYIGFKSVASAIPGLQHGARSPIRIHRTLWRLESSLTLNLQNLSVDGRVFERLTGLSPVG